MSCCKVGKEPADWSKDSKELKRERFGYYVTGWATGPDTVRDACLKLLALSLGSRPFLPCLDLSLPSCRSPLYLQVLGSLWSVGFLLAVTSDASCHIGPSGLSSGADGMACTLTESWNQTLFESVGGDACYGTSTLGVNRYYHDPSNAGCMQAFTTYRAQTSFTCNCSGSSADHALLGSNGLRPSIVFTITTTLQLITTAIIQPILGTAIDYTSRRKKYWLILTIVSFPSDVRCTFSILCCLVKFFAHNACAADQSFAAVRHLQLGNGRGRNQLPLVGWSLWGVLHSYRIRGCAAYPIVVPRRRRQG